MLILQYIFKVTPMFEAIITPVQARNNPIPEIEIRFDIKNTEERNIFLLGYALDFNINGVTVGKVADYISHQIYAKGQTTFNQKFSIPHHIFAAIEGSRKSGDVQLYSNIKALYFDSEIDKPTQYQNLPRSSTLSTTQHKLSQKEWIKIISDLGYTKHKIFEIPYPDIPQLPEIKNIMQKLEEAQNLFYEGKNNEVVTTCRLLLEELQPIVSSNNSKNSKMKSEIANIVNTGCFADEDKGSKSEKIENIRRAVWMFHHIGPHYKYAVTRADAELALVLSMSLLRYYGVQLDEFSRTS